MPTTSLSKTQFEHELDALARLQEKVVAVLRPAVEAFLNFANEYRRLSKLVGRDRQRTQALRARLGINDYQHQRFMAIAETSATLSTFKRALPPAVEPLYEVARLVRDSKGKKRLGLAVKRYELTPTTGTREVRAIKNSMRQRPAKSSRTIAVESPHPVRLEFVFERDDVPRWSEVEGFKTDLVALLLKHTLRLDSEGFKNEKALREYIEQYWALREKGAENQQVGEQPESATHDEGNLEALDKAYQALLPEHHERIRVRAEKGIGSLIHKEFQRRLGAELSRVGMLRPRLRMKRAHERMTIKSDEVHGGELELHEALFITSSNVQNFITQAETREGATTRDGQSASILLQAAEIKIPESAMAAAIVEARDSVKESARLRKAREAYERAAAAYQQGHAAEINADIDSDIARFDAMANRGRHRPFLKPLDEK